MNLLEERKKAEQKLMIEEKPNTNNCFNVIGVDFGSNESSTNYVLTVFIGNSDTLYVCLPNRTK